MFGWIRGRKLEGKRIWELGGKRICELESTVELSAERYVRLMRDCDAQHHNILILRERLEKQDALIAQLEDVNRSHP